MDEVGSAVLIIAQAKVKLLCTKFLQANHDAAAAQVRWEFNRGLHHLADQLVF